MKLTAAGMAKAREFVQARARPLEKSLWDYYFENGPREAVLAALGRFQNSDGGFGHGLEPDLRTPASSGLCTSYALEIFSELKVSKDAPNICQAVAYLAQTFNPWSNVWPIIPEAAQHSPHAPWWNGEKLEERFEGFLSNPRAKLCGYLLDYAPPELKHFTDDLLLRVVEQLERMPDHTDGDTLRCYLALFQARNLPAPMQTRIQEKLRRMIPVCVEADPAKWGGYCLKPLWTVKAPSSPFCGLIQAAVEADLDYEIQNQSADGSWKPFWTWGGVFPNEWQNAEREWRGILTLDTVRALKAFGRVEN